MKKAVKTALVIALLLIMAGAMLVAVELLRGTSLQELVNNGSFTISVTDLGVDAKYKACESGAESFSPDEVQRIDLGWIAGTVKFESGNGQQIKLAEQAARELKDGEKLRWKLENGTLSLRYCANGQRNVPEKDLTLTVPADWTAEWIDAGATSGDMTLRGLSVEKKLEVGATSGDLRVENCVCDRLEAGATSGSVTLQGCVCRKLEVTTTSGEIAVRCEAEEMSLGSTSGNIRCEDVPPLCEVDCGATSGTVRMSLRDAQNRQQIKIDTTSGDVYLDVPGAMDLDYDTVSGDLRGSLTQDEGLCPRVEVEATSGDLILGKLPA